MYIDSVAVDALSKQLSTQTSPLLSHSFALEVNKLTSGYPQAISLTVEETPYVLQKVLREEITLARQRSVAMVTGKLLRSSLLRGQLSDDDGDALISTTALQNRV